MTSRLWGLAPWAGLMAAAGGWALHQQVVSEALHFDCHATEGAAGIGWGVLSLLLIGAGAFASWRALPAKDDATKPNPLRRFIVHLSLMAAMLATLGIAFQVLAAAIVPGCRP
jgi:hypothetical protein